VAIIVKKFVILENARLVIQTLLLKGNALAGRTNYECLARKLLIITA